MSRDNRGWLPEAEEGDDPREVALDLGRAIRSGDATVDRYEGVFNEKSLIFVHDYDGEWAGVYLDKKLVIQGHSFTPEEVMDALGVDYGAVEVNLEELGDCPEDFDELREYVR